MSAYKKQHFISETYLKHFSVNSDGIGIFVIDSANQYNKGIQKKNSGDKIFWKINYSDTPFFNDRKALEKMFGSEIENGYNKIVEKIHQEKPEIDFGVKQELIRWIFYTKLRSPIWKNHIANFTDYNYFKKTMEEFATNAMTMRWTIYKSPEHNYWWTSDNAGYCLNTKDYKKTGKLDTIPIYQITGTNSVLFYPISKEYCLNIHPYYKNDSVFLNLENTNMTYENSTTDFVNFINRGSYITRNNLIISAEKESLQTLLE